MINSVGMNQNQYVAPQKVSGKTHCRKDELSSYRTVLNIASDNLCIAAQEGNMEAYDLCTKVIDFTQAKIDSIIAQEDNHYYKTSDISMSKKQNTAEVMDKMVNTADKSVDIANKVVSNSSKGLAAGKLLDLVS